MEPFFNEKIEKESINCPFFTKNDPVSKSSIFQEKKLNQLIVKTSNPQKNSIQTRRIEFFPTEEPRKILIKWCNDSRFIYNLTIENIKKYNIQFDLWVKEFSVKRCFCEVCDSFTEKRTEYCDHCGTRTVLKEDERIKKNLESTPEYIRLNSMKDAFNEDSIEYKSRKRIFSDSISIDKNSIEVNDKELKIFNQSILCDEILPESFEYDPQIEYNFKTKRFFFCIPYRKITENKKIISLDPGNRTFLTGYDPSNGECIEFNNRIKLLKRLTDKIESMKSNNISKRKIQKQYNRISNLISDVQWRFVTYLTKNYDEIIVPKFYNQEMSKRDDFNRHNEFLSKLKWKCRELNIKLVIMDESYTTRTCGVYGAINRSMTIKNKTFNCSDESCRMKDINRDYHAARNIFLKTKCSI